jgi:hypothetical protein
MRARIVITLILGLVFQLAQVLPGAIVAVSCAPQAESCKCCSGLDSCPCADDREPAQQPAPVIPDSGSVLKPPAANVGDPRLSIGSLVATRPAADTAASPVAGPPTGYPGVRLSVAFCCFVI